MNELTPELMQQMRILKESGVDNEGIAATLNISVEQVITSLPIVFGHINTIVELKATAGKLMHMVSEMGVIIDKAKDVNATYKELTDMMKEQQSLVTQRVTLLSQIADIESKQKYNSSQQDISSYTATQPIDNVISKPEPEPEPVTSQKPVNKMSVETKIQIYKTLINLSMIGFDKNNIDDISIKEQKALAKSIDSDKTHFLRIFKRIKQGRIPKLTRSESNDEIDIETIMRMKARWLKQGDSE